MARNALKTQVSTSILDTVLQDDTDQRRATGSVVESIMPAIGMSLPFTKAQAKYCQRNVEEGKASYQIIHSKWDRIFEEYQKSGDEGELELSEDYNLHMGSPADENIIRTNIKTMMRTTYMQNPHVEFTDVNEDSKLGVCLEYILDFLMNKRTYPGLNMKARARRWLMHGQMTNFGIIRLDYQPREGSREEAVKALQELEDQLKKVKKNSEVEQIMARLEILHERLPLLKAKGMEVSNVLSHRVIVHKHCSQLDLSDSDFLAEEIDYERSYIMEKYYTHTEGEGYRLRSNPKITATRSTGSADTDPVAKHVTDTVMNTKPTEIGDLALKGTIRCYMYYDRLLKRHYLFNSENWEHPLYAWEDDMGLSRYFRHFVLAFGEPVDSVIQPGEVSFYYGQVAEINRINRETKRIRDTIFNTIVYNKQGVDPDEVKKLIRHLKNPRQVAAFGINADEGKKISDVLELLVPPAAQAKEVFDDSKLRASIDRSSSMSEIDRGGQFKTNTTNEQVNFYANQKQRTEGVLVDTIEDAMDDLAWAMSEIIVSKYSQQDIVDLIGPKRAVDFEQLSVEEFNRTYRMVLSSGSIEKPTSENKKREAIEVSQVLGQVGQAAPGAVMKIMIKLLRSAFTSLQVTKEDMDLLDQEVAANLQKGVSTDGTPQPAAGQQPPAGPPAAGNPAK